MKLVSWQGRKKCERLSWIGNGDSSGEVAATVVVAGEAEEVVQNSCGACDG